jgi:hypothetical protein
MPWESRARLNGQQRIFDLTLVLGDLELQFGGALPEANLCAAFGGHPCWPASVAHAAHLCWQVVRGNDRTDQRDFGSYRIGPLCNDVGPFFVCGRSQAGVKFSTSKWDDRGRDWLNFWSRGGCAAADGEQRQRNNRNSLCEH